MTKSRADELAEKYSADNSDQCSFKAGWTARDEEVDWIKAINQALDESNIAAIKERNQTKSELESAKEEIGRLRTAILERLKLGCDCGNEYINGELTPYQCGLHEALESANG